MKKLLLYTILVITAFTAKAQKQAADYVNPFIGSSNYGTTNPGALCPQGLMSVTPFNVMGSESNKFDKDKHWWSTPYAFENSYLTGFAHVNLSGVGCPDMGSLLLMPTHGKLEVDYRKYGSEYRDEKAVPGYYSTHLTKYDILAEVSASMRTGIARFTFPEGENHILLNLGEGLTNETGAMIRRVNEYEFEGTKLLGTFCYTESQAVFPIYFVMRVNKKPAKSGYWKFQRPGYEWENEWNLEAGKYKIYTEYSREIAGDNVGAWLSFDFDKEEEVIVQMGVSFVSMENARLNLETEQPDANFDAVRKSAYDQWNTDLSRVEIEGGSDDEKTVFYTGLYHALIHPNILQDVNGEYPAYESYKTMHTRGNRYTVYSLWDTYRNVHPLMTLLFPDRQKEMIQTMLDMYKESGWMPKWELYGRESLTMEGDPAVSVIVDSWMKGLRGYDIELAYEAMYKSATTPGPQNKLRPDNDDYMQYGYVPLRGEFDNSVSHAVEYYIADWNIAQLARELGKMDDYHYFLKRSLGYKHYFSKEYGTFRPILPDEKFLTPFDPLLGANFEPNPGFHEGNAWNYTFAVPHDVEGMIKLHGGKKKFVERLQSVFDNGYFDVTNEPDIVYPHLFSYIKGEEWRTQKLVSELLRDHFTNEAAGLPGNDDSGTLSTWAVFNMMGFYPACPGKPEYVLLQPTFDKVTIHLDNRYYSNNKIEIEKSGSNNKIKSIVRDGKRHRGFTIQHDDLVNSKKINIVME